MCILTCTRICVGVRVCVCVCLCLLFLPSARFPAQKLPYKTSAYHRKPRAISAASHRAASAVPKLSSSIRYHFIQHPVDLIIQSFLDEDSWLVIPEGPDAPLSRSRGLKVTVLLEFWFSLLNTVFGPSGSRIAPARRYPRPDRRRPNSGIADSSDSR